MPNDPLADLFDKPRTAKPRRYDEDSALDLIAQHESGGRNIKQQIVPAGGGYNPSVGRVTGPSTASGPWQITNSTWRKRAPQEIAQKYPTAMSAPVEVQRAVAGKIFRETGFQDWEPYNASLRRAIARGEQPKSQVGSAQPQQADPLSDLFDAPTEKPAPRSIAPPVLTRPRPRGGQVESAGLGPQFPQGTTTGLATSRNASLVGRQRTPQISRADLQRAEDTRRPQPTLADVRRREERITQAVSQQQTAGQEALRTNPTSAQARLYDPRLDEQAEVTNRIDTEIEAERIQAMLEANRPKVEALKRKIRDLAGDSHGGRMVQSIQSALANTGIQTGNLIQGVTAGRRGSGLTEEMRIAQQALAELDAEDPDKGWLAAAERSLPGAAVELAKMATLSRVPVAGRATLPALGALSEADKGVEEAAKGAVIGEAYHRGFGALSRLPKVAQFGVGTAVPAAVSIAEGEDPKKAILSNTAFGAMALATPKPRGQVREPTKVSESIRGISEPTIREEVLSQPVEEVVARPPELRRGNESDLGARTRSTIPEVGPVDVSPRESLAPVETPRHVDLQQRYKRGSQAGNFKKETRAQAEERRNQVRPVKPETTIPPAELSTPRPSSAPSEVTPTTPVRSASDLKAAFEKHFRLAPAEADAVSRIADARAETWAKQKGKTKEEWYQSRIAGVTEGGKVGEGALYQSESPFYSQLARVIDQKMPNRASSEQVRAIIESPQSGVKAEEIKWTGLDDFLRERRGATKQEVQEFLRQNQVEVREVEKGKSAPKEASWTPDEFESAINAAERRGEWEEAARLTRVQEDVTLGSNANESGNDTKFAKFQLPGGENYRELLLTLPKKSAGVGEPVLKQNASGMWAWFYGDVQDTGAFRTRQEAAAARSQMRRPSFHDKTNFQSSHFDEPNILAHVRFNDRIVDGKKVLFIEEVQSDWHQKGRSGGYATKVPQIGDMVRYRSGQQFNDAYLVRMTEDGRAVVSPYSDGRSRTSVLDLDRLTSINRDRVPDAPFKKTWHELAMKRMMRYATENGYDRIAWTTGEQQAERYDLSKHLDKLFYGEKSGSIEGYKDGKLVIQQTTSPDKLPDYIGKEAAAKILTETPNRYGNRELSGLDLKGGGEGMKGFYDQILPSFVNKYGKKWGARVEEGRVPQQRVTITKRPRDILVEHTSERGVEKYVSFKRDDIVKAEARAAEWRAELPSEPVHSVDITPSMKKSVMEGQPLFQSNKASTEFLEDGRAIIRALKKPDVSSAAHEVAHVFRRDLEGDLLKAAESWTGVPRSGKWEVVHEEKFARGFERYLRDGRAPTEQLKQVFQQFKEWLTNIYAKVKGTPLENELSPEIREVFDRLLGKATPTVPLLKREPIPIEKPPALTRTSARQEMTSADRAELDLPELPPAERKSWQRTLEEAKAKGSHNASVLADEVLAKPRPLSDVETAQLVLRASELKTIHAERMKEIEAATDPDVIQAKRNQAEALENEFNKLTSATKASGTETGRALAARKLTINQDFDLISVLQRAKAAKGRELNAKEREKFEGMTKRVTELETKLTEAQEALKTRSIQREIDKIKKQTTRAVNRRALDDEFADLRTAFAQAKLETRSGVQASGLAALDPEGKLTVLMVRMARNRVRAGVNDAAQVVDTVYEAVREHVEGITKREIRDAISGYGLTKDRRSDVEREIARLRNEMKRISREEDIEAGVLSRRREGPRQSESSKVPMAGPRPSEARSSGVPLQGPKRGDVRRVPLQGPKPSEASRSGQPLQGPKMSDVRRLPAAGPTLSEGMGRKAGPRVEDAPFVGPRRSDANKLPAEGPKITDAPFVGPRKNTIRQRIEEQIQEYERKLRERDFAEEPSKPRPIYDRETSNLQAQLEGLKRQVDAEIRGNDSRLEVILSMRKAGMLTGLRTHMRNVGGTGAFQAFEEVSRIPGSLADLLVSTVTKQRALGAPNPVDVAKSSYQAATKGLREAAQIMKYGATAEELAKLERPRELKSGSKIVDRYVNTVFRLLGAEDKIFRTYAYERSILEQKRLLKTDKVTPEMEAQGILDAEVSTFNNQNKLAEGVEWVRNRTGVVGSTAIDLVIPFRRTPANITSRLLESTPLGLGRGTLQLFKAALNKKMSFEDQRKFSQTIGRSVTGSSLLLLGYWLASQGLATGLSESDAGDREVQKAAGRAPLAIKIGSNWHQVGSFSPIGNLLAVGAALYREQTRPLKEGEERGNLATAAMPVAARVMMDQPFLKGTSGALEAIESPYSRGEAFVGQTVGSFVPTAVADVASLEDNKRRIAKTIPERVLTRVPLLRRNLREDLDVFARPLQSRRTAIVDPTLSARDSDEPFIKELIRLDVGVPKANKKPGESEDRYRARQVQQGQEMAKLLSQTVASRGYQQLNDADKVEMLKNVIEQTRKAVNAGSNPAGQERRRPRREVQVPTLLRRELRQIERRAQ